MQISLSSKTKMGEDDYNPCAVLTHSWASPVPTDCSCCCQCWTGSVFSYDTLEFMMLNMKWNKVFYVAQTHLWFNLPLKLLMHLYRVLYLAGIRKKYLPRNNWTHNLKRVDTQVLEKRCCDVSCCCFLQASTYVFEKETHWDVYESQLLTCIRIRELPSSFLRFIVLV